MINPLEFNSREHTPQYLQNYQLLTGFKVMRGEVEDHVSFYAPGPEDVYFMTKFMRDDELDFINQIRAEKRFRKKDGSAALLPRLAFIGENGFKACTNQAERKAIESRIFADKSEPININPEKMVKFQNLSGRR